MTPLDSALRQVDTWPGRPRAAVVDSRGAVAVRGDEDLVGRWASVTKLVTALAVLVDVDGGRVGLDDPAGPPGATVRHLLGHASGLPFEGTTPIARPGSRRIYSNAGFDLLGTVLAERHGRPVAEILATEVLAPLDLADTRLIERPSQGLEGSLLDLAKLAHELLSPTIVARATLAAATTIAFPGLAGVLPGVGRFDANDWGLGFELRSAKAPHWTGARNDPATFGHFGGSGSFLWVDPVAGIALAALTDEPYGPWALDAWPRLADAVLGAAGADAR